jgi:hypothetical protein
MQKDVRNIIQHFLSGFLIGKNEIRSVFNRTLLSFNFMFSSMFTLPLSSSMRMCCCMSC